MSHDNELRAKPRHYRPPASVQIDKQFRMSWDAHLAAAVSLAGRRCLFFLAKNWCKLALAATLLVLARMVWAWYLRGGMPLP